MVSSTYIRILQLPDLAHPVDGTESMECVQGGVSRKVLISELLINNAGFLMVVDQSGLFPQSRQIAAGPGIELTDGGAGGTLSISSTGAPPTYVSVAPAAGIYNNYVLPGTSDYILDVDTTAGNVSFSGFISQRDGQKLFITDTGANFLNILSLNAGSNSANRIRIPTDLTAILNNTITLQYSSGAGKWFAI